MLPTLFPSRYICKVRLAIIDINALKHFVDNKKKRCFILLSKGGAAHSPILSLTNFILFCIFASTDSIPTFTPCITCHGGVKTLDAK